MTTSSHCRYSRSLSYERCAHPSSGRSIVDELIAWGHLALLLGYIYGFGSLLYHLFMKELAGL